MSRHLSSDQIAEWMLGAPSADAAQHVRECGECSTEIDRLTESLSMFRGAVRETAESQKVLQLPNQMAKRRVAVLWATVAAALVSLAVLPIYHGKKVAETARQDAELMEQVNLELSLDVASPMKPLQKMVSWGPDARKY